MEDKDGKLPNQKSGHVKGLSGQTWNVLDQAVRHRSNGLTRSGVTGLPHLFQIYGLKTMRTENREVLESAIRCYRETGTHGLHPLPEEDIVTEPRSRRLKKHGHENGGACTL